MAIELLCCYINHRLLIASIRVRVHTRRVLSSTGYADKIPVRDRNDRFNQTAPALSAPTEAVDPYASSDED